MCAMPDAHLQDYKRSRSYIESLMWQTGDTQYLMKVTDHNQCDYEVLQLVTSRPGFVIGALKCFPMNIKHIGPLNRPVLGALEVIHQMQEWRKSM
jgi:hypothetical protein